MNFRPPSDDPNGNERSPFNPERDFSDIPPERRKVVQNQATKLFIVLLAGGLVVGGILAVGLVQVIQNFGLADRPNHPLRFEQFKK